MATPIANPPASGVDVARECLYQFLAALLRDPRSAAGQAIEEAAAVELSLAAVDLLREEAQANPVPLGFGELRAEHLDLRALLAELDCSATERQAQYDRVFGLAVPKECPPYETEYHASGDTFFRSQQMADVAGFYRAFGIMPVRQPPERPDSLPLELEFMAFLLMKRRLASQSDAGLEEEELARLCEDAERAFFRDHLVWWVPAFAAGLRSKAETGIYAALARFLAAWLPAERGRLNVPAPRLPVQPEVSSEPDTSESCEGCSALSA